MQHGSPPTTSELETAIAADEDDDAEDDDDEEATDLEESDRSQGSARGGQSALLGAWAAGSDASAFGGIPARQSKLPSAIAASNGRLVSGHSNPVPGVRRIRGRVRRIRGPSHGAGDGDGKDDAVCDNEDDDDDDDDEDEEATDLEESDRSQGSAVV